MMGEMFRRLTIEEIIRMMGWTNEEVAKFINSSVMTVRRKRRGESEWTATDIKMIAEKANVPISQVAF